MKRQRRRSPAGALGLAVGFLLLGAGATFTVTVALEALTGGALDRPMCHIQDDGGHVRLSPEQMGNAALIAAVGNEMEIGERAVTIALATAMQESSLRNLDYGDRDSLGLFQQRPSQGWGTPEQVQDPVYASMAFYESLLKVPDFANLPLTEAAQAVQISAFPRAYAKHEPLAQALQGSLGGSRPASLTCDLPEGELDPQIFLRELSQAFPRAQTTGVGKKILLSAPGPGPAWMLAHWAVATAGSTGVREVLVDEHRWTPATGWQEHSVDVPGVLIG